MRIPATGAAGAAVVVIVFGFLLASPARLADLDSSFGDVLTGWSGHGKQSGQVVIVAIDERSLSHYGRWPWPRDLVNQLVRRILDYRASTVVLDMMFPQADPGHDEVLADAIRGRPVLAGYTMRFDSDPGREASCRIPPLPLVVAGPEGSERGAFFHSTGVVCSVPIISDALAGSGFLNAAPDHDGMMRHVPLIMEMNNRYYPSLALAAVNLYRHATALQLAENAAGARLLHVGSATVPLEGPSLVRLRFRGAAQTFPYISADDVLSGGAREELLRGKMVVVGGTASGIENRVLTPVDPMLPGVELQATLIDNLIAGDFFHHPGNARFWELAAALLAGVASTWLLMRLSFFWGPLAVVGLGAAAWGACALALEFSRTLYSPLPVTAMLVCTLPVVSLFNYVREKNRAEQTQKQLTTMMQRSLEALLESESRYHRLVDNINDAITVHDVAGRLVFANRRFREWFDLKEEDVGSILLETFVAPEWREEVRNRHDRLMRGETVPDHFEFEAIRPDGSRISIEALVTTVDENGHVMGAQAALRDTTERKRIEAQYLQARKMDSVGRLAGGVAHDFNNLLTVIIAYSDMLLEEAALTDPSRSVLEEIRKAANRAAELTRKLLAFSRKQLVQPRPVNLNFIVAESQRMLERVIGEDIQLITLLSPDLGYVTADPGQLHQVLMNLLVNARDAMPHGGKVVVETRNVDAQKEGDPSSGPLVYLEVTDSGIGMSDQVKQHLFEPFFTTKNPGQGTGLGLATVYGIVQQIGGRIEVASDLGKGTSFRIHLPRGESPLPEQAVATPSATQLAGSETVLVVEDQEVVRELVTTILKKYGYCVLEASNGPDAIVLAERHPAVIHLLLTDIIMPLMDGRVLRDKLKAVRQDMKVLYMSGYSEEQIGRSRAIDADLAYLHKPFTPEVLAAKVREILGEGGSQRRTAGTES